MLPKIHVYTIVKNEEQIMPFFMRHYSAFADRIYVLDDMSMDRTAEICDDYEKCVRIPYRIGAIDDVEFARIFSTFYKGMSRGKCDWVICVDADEFVYFGNDFPHNLSIAEDMDVRCIKAEGYQMVGSARPMIKGSYVRQITDCIFSGFYDEMYSKPCIFNPCIDIRFHPGRHEADLNGTMVGRIEGVKLLHYRYFGPESVIERNLKNTMNLSKNNYSKGYGIHNLPSNTGKYSPEWWKQMAKEAKPCLD